MSPGAGAAPLDDSGARDQGSGAGPANRSAAPSSSWPAGIEVAEGPRMPALDGLRAIAILLVLFFHYEVRELPRSWLTLPGWALVHVGWLGVDLFFVLSGFLITGILCDTRSSGGYFRNFYARRTLRILPLYYGFLLLVFLLLGRIFPWDIWREPDAATQAWFWLHASNFLVSFRGWAAAPPLVPHFWSLAVEEQFYLVWPAVVYFVKRRTLLRICVGCIVTAWCVRVGLRFTSLPWYACQTFTLARLDALGFGALVAVLLRGPSAPLVKRWAAPVAAITGAAWLTVFVWRRFDNARDAVVATLGMALFASFAAAGVAWGAVGDAGSPVGRLLRGRLLRALGRYSYGMYVVHLLVMKLTERWGFTVRELSLRHPTWVAHLAYLSLNLGGTLALAMLSFHLFESRLLALKHHFAPEG